jgi:hypothetical protein
LDHWFNFAFVSGQLHNLQKRYRSVEDELSKKRAELRELLRQESVEAASSVAPPPPPPPGSSLPPPPSGEIVHQGSAATLELLTESGEFRRQHRAESASSFASLPKVELKSVARVIEEKEQLILPPPPRSNSYDGRRHHLSSSSTSSSAAPRPAAVSVSSVWPRDHSPVSSSGVVQHLRDDLSNHSGSTRHRSGGGTPNSVKSKVSIHFALTIAFGNGVLT